MRLVRLKTIKELRDSGQFKLSVEGRMVGFTRHGTSTTFWLDMEHGFGEVVLATDHETLHTNLFRAFPELIKEDMKITYVSSTVYGKVCERLSIIEKIIHNKYEHTILALKERLGRKESTDKLNARIKALEAQLELSKKFTQEWRNEAASKSNTKIHTAQARKDENKEIQDLGEKVYKEATCKTS